MENLEEFKKLLEEYLETTNNLINNGGTIESEDECGENYLDLPLLLDDLIEELKTLDY